MKNILLPILGGLSGIAIGCFIILPLINGTLSCNKKHEMLGGVKSRLDIAATFEKKMNVKFLSYDVDSDDLVTASWEYSDHRIGGTDWTDSKNVGLLVNEQRHWKACMDTECLWVVPPNRESEYHGKCWRHFPIPEIKELMSDEDIKEHI